MSPDYVGGMPTGMPMTVAALIRTGREAAGLSQAELARRTKVGRSVICKLELSRRLASGRSLVALAQALDLDAGALLAQAVEEGLVRMGH